MGECTYCNSLKISRCNERSSGRAREREKEKVIIVWREQEEEENRSDIMVFAIYNFANICLPFLQLLEQALRSCTTTCRKKIGFICILCMRSKSRSRTCRKIGFIKTPLSILIKRTCSTVPFIFSLDLLFIHCDFFFFFFWVKIQNW